MVVVNLRSDIWIASGKERCHSRHDAMRMAEKVASLCWMGRGIERRLGS